MIFVAACGLLIVISSFLAQMAFTIKARLFSIALQLRIVPTHHPGNHNLKPLLCSLFSCMFGSESGTGDVCERSQNIPGLLFHRVV